MKPFDLTFVSFSSSFDMEMETTPMLQRALKRQAISHTKVAGKTIRRTALANNSTRMLASIMATGRMAAAMVKV